MEFGKNNIQKITRNGDVPTNGASSYSSSNSGGNGGGNGLNISSGILSVGYGSVAGTACQGNDDRLSNSRPASDVYAWAKQSAKPGYSWNEIGLKPTTLAGYGITDAKIANGAINIGGSSIAPLTSHQSLAGYATENWVNSIIADMFEKVNIPVLGVIENMSYHVCSKCGHKEMIFGEGGGIKMAQQQGVQLLGQVPLHIHIREQSDDGVPIVVAEPHSKLAVNYQKIARKIAASLYFSGKTEPSTIFAVNR